MLNIFGPKRINQADIKKAKRQLSSLEEAFRCAESRLRTACERINGLTGDYVALATDAFMQHHAEDDYAVRCEVVAPCEFNRAFEVQVITDIGFNNPILKVAHSVLGDDSEIGRRCEELKKSYTHALTQEVICYADPMHLGQELSDIYRKIIDNTLIDSPFRQWRHKEDVILHIRDPEIQYLIRVEADLSVSRRSGFIESDIPRVRAADPVVAEALKEDVALRMKPANSYIVYDLSDRLGYRLLADHVLAELKLQYRMHKRSKCARSWVSGVESPEWKPRSSVQTDILIGLLDRHYAKNETLRQTGQQILQN